MSYRGENLVANVLTAIQNNTIKGKFNADKTEFEFDIVKTVTKLQQVQFWTLKVNLQEKQADGKYENIPFKNEYITQPSPAMEGPKFRGLITTDQWNEKTGHHKKTKPTYVLSGKNKDRSNYQNVPAQTLLEAYSKYTKYVKQKSAIFIDDNDKPRIKSMLVSRPDCLQTINDTDFVKEPYPRIQMKYDGDNVLATLMTVDGAQKVDLSSRNGTTYLGKNHIREELMPALTAYPNWYLNGEIYLHGKSHEYISGQARKEQDEGNMEFHVFDVYIPGESNLTYLERRQKLVDFFAENPQFKYVKLAPEWDVTSIDEIIRYRDQFMEDGYEGAIVRRPTLKYEPGVRSCDIIKYKLRHDDDFKCIGYTAGEKGMYKGAVIWICEVGDKIAKEKKLTKKQREFRVSPKDLTVEDRQKVYKELSRVTECVEDGKVIPKTVFDCYFYGKLLTISYFSLSEKTGKPIHGNVIGFKRDMDEGDKDPIQKLLEGYYRK
jgi:hypothetical protein